MSSKLKEYLVYADLLNAAAETINLNTIDAACNDVDEIFDFTEEYTDVTAFENQIDEWDEVDDYQNNDYQGEADIVQCIINIIELSVILNDNVEKIKPKRCRRWGVHPINHMRNEKGHFQNLFKEMRTYDHEKFFNYTRMTPQRFDHLLKLMTEHITKLAPNAIPPECRLLITLR